jgi:hypothetical protein
LFIVHTPGLCFLAEVHQLLFRRERDGRAEQAHQGVATAGVFLICIDPGLGTDIAGVTFSRIIAFLFMELSMER